MVRVAALVEELQVVRLHRRRIDRVGSAKAMLEAGTGAKILELGLHHRAEVARRVVPELHNATGIAVKDEHHSTPNLSRGHCHIVIPELRSTN